jgi:hypothetical protein
MLLNITFYLCLSRHGSACQTFGVMFSQGPMDQRRKALSWAGEKLDSSKVSCLWFLIRPQLLEMDHGKTPTL